MRPSLLGGIRNRNLDVFFDSTFRLARPDFLFTCALDDELGSVRMEVPPVLGRRLVATPPSEADRTPPTLLAFGT